MFINFLRKFYFFKIFCKKVYVYVNGDVTFGGIYNNFVIIFYYRFKIHVLIRFINFESNVGAKFDFFRLGFNN